MVEAVMGHLLRDGVVERGQLGVLITDHTALVEEALELGAERGALVTQVFPGSAAERAGLQATDLVIGINDKAVNSSRDLRNAVGLAGIDQDMKIDVLRDGDPLLISVRLENASSNQSAAGGDRQTNERRATESRFLGAQLQDLPDGRAGVGVATVDPQSRAAAGGLQAGDMITALNRQSVDDLAELNSLLSAQPPLLALNVERDGQSLLLIMP
jgi:S1-C subfamily serine protease